MSVEFQKLSEVRLDQIIDMVNDIFADYVIPIKWDMFSFEMDVKENSISLEDSFLMTIEGEKIGISINAFRRPRGRIDAFGIKKEYRNKRVGSALLNYSVDVFKWKGINEVTLEVAVNDSSVHFYEKHGFKARRTLISYYIDRMADAEGHEKCKFEEVTNDEIYNEAVENQKEKWRFPNWQREPTTLKLSENRYRHDLLVSKGRELGYAVWGVNNEGAYVVDAAPKHSEDYDEFFMNLLLSIKDETEAQRILLMNVPQNDPLSNAAIASGMTPFFNQLEMSKI